MDMAGLAIGLSGYQHVLEGTLQDVKEALLAVTGLLEVDLSCPPEYDQLLVALTHLCSCLELLRISEERLQSLEHESRNLRGVIEETRAVVKDTLKITSSTPSFSLSFGGRRLGQHFPRRSSVQELVKRIRNLNSQYQQFISNLSFLKTKEFSVPLLLHSTTHGSLEGFETILDWISGLNFAADQVSLTELRVPGTGQWFLTSATVQIWVGKYYGLTYQPVLLCQGMPGAGKTVVTAVLIELLANSSQDGQEHGLAYTYCSERNNYSSHALLSSLVKQLCRGRKEQQVMARLRSFHDGHQPRGLVPSILEVSELLEYVVTLYPHVYLVADGLDEMPMDERGSFLRALGLLCRRQQHVRFLAVARWGIEYQFKEHFDNYVTQAISATEEDIRTYVQHQLSNHRRLPEQLLARQDENCGFGW